MTPPDQIVRWRGGRCSLRGCIRQLRTSLIEAGSGALGRLAPFIPGATAVAEPIVAIAKTSRPRAFVLRARAGGVLISVEGTGTVAEPLFRTITEALSGTITRALTETTARALCEPITGSITGTLTKAIVGSVTPS